MGSNFRGWQIFKVFVDVSDHAHYPLYNRTYFMGLIFTDSHLSAKIGLNENFPLCGRLDKSSLMRVCSIFILKF